LSLVFSCKIFSTRLASWGSISGPFSASNSSFFVIISSMIPEAAVGVLFFPRFSSGSLSFGVLSSLSSSEDEKSSLNLESL
jgi:hypothetical protein